MKTLSLCLLLFMSSQILAEETTTDRPVADAPVMAANPTTAQVLANPELYANHPQIAPYLTQARETLNLGSNEDVIALARRINPQIIEKIQKLDVQLTDDQIARLEELALANKTKLIASLITGSYPEELMQQAAEIVPELGEMPEEDKKDIFTEARKTVNHTLFESMVEAEAQLGYLLGDTTSGGVAQLNANLLNLRTLTFGDITISNVHAEVQVGYPQNGFLLLSGEVAIKDSKFSYEGQLLGLTYDIRKRALEFNIATARVNYNLFPWLRAYGALGIGIRHDLSGTLLAIDPTIGVEAKTNVGPVRVQGFVQGQYQVLDRNAVLSCGGSAGLEILNKETVQIQTGIMTQLNVQSNPGPLDNRVEWLNTAGISGRF